MCLFTLISSFREVKLYHFVTINCTYGQHFTVHLTIVNSPKSLMMKTLEDKYPGFFYALDTDWIKNESVL